MTFPREHRARIASTNPPERVNREVKRRPDVIGIFPNDEAILRLVGALMLETNDERAVARRYMPHMPLETLARVTDNPAVRPSAAATRSSLDLSEGRRSCTMPWDTIRTGPLLPKQVRK